MKRFIQIETFDGRIIEKLELSKVTSVRTDKQMIHLDKLDDGTWRFIYNPELIPDIKNLECLRIIREDD